MPIRSKKEVNESRQGTARAAVQILLNKKAGFIDPKKQERLNILVAFAKKNKVVYGRAFDVIKISGKMFDLKNPEEVEKNLSRIIVYEIKSTSKKDLKKDFRKYFFGLTTAELLVAQNLKSNFKFIFVNIKTKESLELTLKGVFKRARGIYPVWSIQF